MAQQCLAEQQLLLRISEQLDGHVQPATPLSFADMLAKGNLRDIEACRVVLCVSVFSIYSFQ